ncbi:MAG: HAD family hydrolase, partial [Candidatus Wallbacteria bacterium]|nr:HAD family hydrolase [Candidatus Wallbacteria bacterium]
MKPAPRIGVFFDRDGTLTVDDEGYVGDPDRLVPRPEAREAVQLLKAAGAFVFLATNQSGVARGLFDEAAVARVNARLEELLGVRFDAVYVCPHHPTEGAAPYRAMCRCRKPEPGLLERGLSDWRLKAEDCYVVGDAARDVLAGRRLGLRTVLLLNGRNSDDPPAAPDHATNSLTDAARWVLADAKESQTMMELIIKQLKESAAVKLAMVEKNAADIARAAEV